MAWIDSHCHLDHAAFRHDLPQVLQAAKDLGIQQFIVPGVGFHQWEEQQRIQAEYPETYHAFGVHPWFCDLHHEEHLEQLDDLLDSAIAVGECGLDGMPGKPAMNNQQWWLDKQLALAKKHDLPVIIHSVRTCDRVMAALKPYPNIRGMIHGFGGSLQQAELWVKRGFVIGIGTRLIRTNPDKVKTLVTALPLSAMILETDAPDGMGKHIRNEPKELMLVANVVAKLRGETAATVLDASSQNAKELFAL